MTRVESSLTSHLTHKVISGTIFTPKTMHI